MLPKLDVLIKKCANLGLIFDSTTKMSKAGCVKLLRKHYLAGAELPYTEVTPMLCFSETNLNPEEKDYMWESDHWVAQEKLNGCRAILHFIPGKGVFAHTRTTSVKTFRYQEFTESLLFANFKDCPVEFVIDTEVIVEKSIDTREYTKGKGEITQTSLHSTVCILHLDPAEGRLLQTEQNAPLKFEVFDILKMGTKDLKMTLLADRLTDLEIFKTWVQASRLTHYFKFPPVIRTEKRAFFNKIVSEGGEGIVLKNLNSPYEDSSSRKRKGWVKVKKKLEMDAFVTGFTRGEEGTAWRNMIGAIKFSVVKETGGLHEIAICSSMTQEDRENFTVYNAEYDSVDLNPDVYKRVAEISGQEITPRNFKIAHARIERWRVGIDQKEWDECKVNMSDLEKMVALPKDA